MRIIGFFHYRLVGDGHCLDVSLGFSRFLPAELFQSTGSGANAALLNTVIIGAVNVACTVVAILVVDRCATRLVGPAESEALSATAAAAIVGTQAGCSGKMLCWPSRC
jgi:hypothetical protein